MAIATNVQPSAYTRRSFLYRKLAATGANFGEVGGPMDGGAVVLDFGDPEGEAQAARRLGLADLSVLPHTGFKGAGVVEWLRGQGVEVSDEPNWAPTQQGGGLALRQAAAEVMILGDLSGQGGWPERLKQAWRADHPSPFGWLEELAWSADNLALAFSISYDGHPTRIHVAEGDTWAYYNATDVMIITRKDGLVLKEFAPGWTAEEIQKLTEPKLILADDLKEIEL